MEAVKTFERNGVRYRAGDALPDDLDAATKAHYLRYGMAQDRRTPTPAENKPAGVRRPRTPGPKPVATPEPTQTAQAHMGITLDTVDSGPAQEDAPQPTAEQAALAPDEPHLATGVAGDAPGQEG